MTGEDALCELESFAEDLEADIIDLEGNLEKIGTLIDWLQTVRRDKSFLNDCSSFKLDNTEDAWVEIETNLQETFKETISSLPIQH